MTYRSLSEDLALHGVRVLGFPTSSRIAGRFGLSAAAVQEALLDFEARGWVRQLSFAGQSGWSLTDAGRAENERRLAPELDRAGVRDAVTRAHTTFVPLDRRFGAACTDWQIRPAQLRLGRCPDRDSCHFLWIQFHEDLLATLGIPRGSDA